MKIISLVFAFFLFGTLLNISIFSHEIDSSSIYIRLKPTKLHSLSVLQNIKGINSANAMLKPNQSLKFNDVLFSKTLFSNFENINQIIKAEEPLLRTYRINIDDKTKYNQIVKSFKNNPDIEIIEPVYKFRLLSGVQPNDAYYEAYQKTKYEICKLPEAWEIEKGNADVVIGISDGGTEYFHEDLKDKIKININEIPDNGKDDDDNGYIDDYYGYNFAYNYNQHTQGDPSNEDNYHGTHTASIAAASTNNEIGTAGTGFNCSILPMNNAVGDYTYFGFESIIYAALRGVRVLNLSWGGATTYSALSQSIIDYAIAQDVAIVASAGNKEPKYNEPDYITYYPGGYFGVLGVGSSRADDTFNQEKSVLGLSCDILAPTNIFCAATNNDYDFTGDGTSFSAPFVSGIVGLVRSKYPDLKAMQVLELVRQSTDDISELNASHPYAKLIPNRINAYKALTTNPMSIPAIVPVSFKYFNTKGEELERMPTNETIFIRVYAKNYLGAANNLKFTLSEGSYLGENYLVEIKKAVINNISIEANAELIIGDFQISLLTEKDSEIYFRVDIEGENGYKDFFKFAFIPSVKFQTFENDNVRFSLTDRGEFGFYNTTHYQYGAGFEYKGFGNQLYSIGSGLVAAENLTKGIYSFENDFITEKPFTGSQRNIGILKNIFAMSDRNIGIEIKQTAGFPSSVSKSAYIDFEIKNIAGRDLKNLAVGYFLDFDLGGTLLLGKNYTENASELIPAEAQNCSVQKVFLPSIEDSPIYAVGVISTDKNAVPQNAGLKYSIIENFTKDEIIKSLTSGSTWQEGSNSDISLVSGMAFEGVTKNNETKKFRLCIACGDNEDELKIEMKDCLTKPIDVIEDVQNDVITLYPNPAGDYLIISRETSEPVDYKIFNALGQVIIDSQSSQKEIVIDTENFASGVYYIKVFTSNQVLINQFVVE